LITFWLKWLILSSLLNISHSISNEWLKFDFHFDGLNSFFMLVFEANRFDLECIKIDECKSMK